MTTSKERFHAAYREGLNWLRGDGLPVAGSRFEDYDSAIDRFVAADGIPAAWSEDEKYLTYDALLAANDLTFAAAGFGSHLMPDGLRPRLQKMLLGNATEREERPGKDGSTEGRDFGFEVMLGAHLKAAGIEPEFPRIGDLGCAFDGANIFIECKRPQGEGSVGRAVTKAAAQLAKRIGKPDRLAVRVIALSLGKLARHGEELLSVPDVASAREGAFARLVGLVEHLSPNWQLGNCPGVHGFLVQLEVPIHVRDGDGFLAGTFHIINPSEVDDRGPEVYVLGRLRERLDGRTERMF